MAFNLSAQLVLNSPNNLRPIINNIRSQLAGVGQINITAKVSPQVQSSISSLNNSLANVQANAVKASSAINNIGAGGGVNKIGSQFMYATKSVNGFDESMKHAVARLTSYTAGYMGLHKVISMVSRAFADFQDMQSKTVSFGQAANKPISDRLVKEMEQRVRQSAIQYGSKSSNVMEAATTLYKADIPLDKIKASVDLISKLTLNKEIGGNIKGITDTYLILANTFSQSTPEIERSFNSLISVSKKYAIESGGLIELLSKSGGVFKSFGSDMNSLVSMGTAVKQGSRLEDSTIATGLNSVMANIYGKKDIKKRLAGINIDVNDRDTGQARNIIQIMNELATATNKMPDSRKGILLEDIAGKHQLKTLASLLENIALVNKVYADTQKNTNTVDQDAKIAQDELANKINKTRESWNKLVGDIAGSKGFDSLTGQVLGTTNAIIRLGDTISSLLPMIGIVGGGMAASSFMKNGYLPGGSAATVYGPGGAAPLFSKGGLGGYAGRFAQRMGPGLPIGVAIGSEMVAGNTSNPYISSSAQGVGSFAMLSMVINPWIAALGGATIAVTHFAKAVEEETTKRFANTGEESFDKYKQYLHPTSPKAIAELRKAMGEKSTGIVGAIEENPGFWSTLKYSATHYTGWKRSQDAIVGERFTDVQSGAKEKYGSIVQDELTRIAKQGGTKSQYYGELMSFARALGLSNDVIKENAETIQKEIESRNQAIQSNERYSHALRLIEESRVTPMRSIGGNVSLTEGLDKIGTNEYAASLRRMGKVSPEAYSVNNVLQQAKLSKEDQTGWKEKILGATDNVTIKSQVEVLIKDIDNVDEAFHKLETAFSGIIRATQEDAQMMEQNKKVRAENFKGGIVGLSNAQNISQSLLSAKLGYAGMANRFEPGSMAVPANLSNSSMTNIYGTVDGLSSNLKQLTAEYQQSPTEILKTKIDSVVGSLTKMSDATSRLTSAEIALSEIDRKKGNLSNLGQAWYGSDIVQRQKIMMGMGYVGKAMSGGMESLMPNQQQQVSELLNGMLANVKLNKEGQTGKDIFLGMMPGGKSLLGEEKTTQQTMLDIQKDSIKAGQSLLDNQVNENRWYISQLDSILQNHIKGLSEALPQGLPVVGKAMGGRIASSDTVPAMLTPGEFVVNANATAQNLGLLESINQGFARGGRVRMSASEYQAEMAARRQAYADRHTTRDKVLSNRQQNTLWDKITGISNEPKKFYFNGEHPRMGKAIEKPKTNVGLPFPMPQLFNRLEITKPVEITDELNPRNFKWGAPNGRLQANVNAGFGVLTGRPNNESAEERQARIHTAVVANRGYNRGGVVHGYANGGTVQGFNLDVSSLDRLSSSLDKFSKVNIPERITVEVADINHYHTVNNGGALATAIVSEVTATINQLIDRQVRTAINPDTGETRPLGVATPLGR